jgi:hypothetical protein
MSKMVSGAAAITQTRDTSFVSQSGCPLGGRRRSASPRVPSVGAPIRGRNAVVPALISLWLALLCAGCANPGPPKPPSLHLPTLVSDLTAVRTGDRVLLRWTTPSRTTDNFPVKDQMTAQICREASPRPDTAAARPTFCSPVLRLTVAPGPSQVSDTLPARLCSDPVVLITYRVQIFNSNGRSAGDSAPAFAASGQAPPPIEALNGTPSERGAVLEWTAPAKSLGDQVELTRTDLSAPSMAAKPAKSARPHAKIRSKTVTPAKSATGPSGPVAFRTAEPPFGTTDTTAKFGGTYTYLAERVRLVRFGTHNLEIDSDPSSPVTIAMRDTFPPSSPTGLATVPGTGLAAPYIDLSWEPNTEPDLAGYRVYRELARPNGDPQGPLARLTPSPVTSPAYRDVAVSPGQRYIYWVTAVDASGNESAPSAKAQEVVTSTRSQK